MSREMERLGRTIRAAEGKGPTRYVNGVTVSVPASRRVQVEVPAGRRPAIIPGSFRAALAVGQEVRLSVVGDTYTVDSVLSALPAPAVAAPPADASSNSASTYTNGTVSSGCYDASSGDAFAYARDVAEVTRFLAGDINELRDDTETNEDAILSVKATLNGVVTKLNALIDTVEAMRTALASQGHIT